MCLLRGESRNLKFYLAFSFHRRIQSSEKWMRKFYLLLLLWWGWEKEYYLSSNRLRVKKSGFFSRFDPVPLLRRLPITSLLLSLPCHPTLKIDFIHGLLACCVIASLRKSSLSSSSVSSMFLFCCKRTTMLLERTEATVMMGRKTGNSSSREEVHESVFNFIFFSFSFRAVISPSDQCGIDVDIALIITSWRKQTSFCASFAWDLSLSLNFKFSRFSRHLTPSFPPLALACASSSSSHRANCKLHNFERQHGLSLVFFCADLSCWCAEYSEQRRIERDLYATWNYEWKNKPTRRRRLE